MSESIDWLPAAAAAPALQSQAAAWLRSMDEDYYASFGLDAAQLESVLASLFEVPNSEFGTARLVLCGGRPAGLIAAFASDEMFARRMQVLKTLLQATPHPAEARERLRGVAGAGRIVPERAWYLAKLYVALPWRRSGLARRMMAAFGEQAAGRGTCLHVRRDNVAALALYHSLGFRVSADPAAASESYSLLEKP